MTPFKPSKKEGPAEAVLAAVVPGGPPLRAASVGRMATAPAYVTAGGREVRVSSPDRVIYEATEHTRAFLTEREQHVASHTVTFLDHLTSALTSTVEQR